MTTPRNENFNCIYTNILKKLYQSTVQQETDTKILSLNKTKSCDKQMSKLEKFDSRIVITYRDNAVLKEKEDFLHISLYETLNT